MKHIMAADFNHIPLNNLSVQAPVRPTFKNSYIPHKTYVELRLKTGQIYVRNYNFSSKKIRKFPTYFLKGINVGQKIFIDTRFLKV